jgi:hypothetical protein
MTIWLVTGTLLGGNVDGSRASGPRSAQEVTSINQL